MSDNNDSRIANLEKYSRDQENFNGKLNEALSGITSLLKDIKSDLRDVSETSKRTEIQANTTNGRVNAHDKQIEELKHKLDNFATAKQVDELHKDLISYKSNQKIVDGEQSIEIKELREERIAFNSKLRFATILGTVVSVGLGLFFQFLTIVGGIISYFLLRS